MPNVETHVRLSAAAPTTTTRQRKRAKDEIAQLRVQVVELHERLTHLQRFCSAPAAKRLRDAQTAASRGTDAHDSSRTCKAASVAANSRSFQRAVAEYKKLERAKAWNLQLRAEVARQQQTNDTLTQLFGLQLSAEVRPHTMRAICAASKYQTLAHLQANIHRCDHALNAGSCVALATGDVEY